jgi:hypothetical protein
MAEASSKKKSNKKAAKENKKTKPSKASNDQAPHPLQKEFDTLREFHENSLVKPALEVKDDVLAKAAITESRKQFKNLADYNRPEFALIISAILEKLTLMASRYEGKIAAEARDLVMDIFDTIDRRMLEYIINLHTQDQKEENLVHFYVINGIFASIDPDQNEDSENFHKYCQRAGMLLVKHVQNSEILRRAIMMIRKERSTQARPQEAQAPVAEAVN